VRGELAGRTVLLTRDEGLADEVRALGAEVRIVELLRYEPVPGPVDLTAFDWIVFTSRRAVEFLDASLGGGPRVAGVGSLAGGPRVACVGPETARAAERAGAAVALVPDRHDAESLAEALIARGPVAGLRVLFPCSERALGTIEGLLGRAGAEVVRHVVYRPVPVEAIPVGATDGVDVAVFLSPSAVEAFAGLGGDLHAARALAIGPTTAAALRARGVEPRIAPTADRAGILSALLDREWTE
jgi:uroporphyrinogen-III synthase